TISRVVISRPLRVVRPAPAPPGGPILQAHCPTRIDHTGGPPASMRDGGIPALAIEEPEDDAEQQAEHKGGADRQVQPKVFPLDDDIARQAPEPQLLDCRPEQSG